MWLSHTHAKITFKTNNYGNNHNFFYNLSYSFIITPWISKKSNSLIYISCKAGLIINRIATEFTNIRFKYVGKAYRISKKKKILLLNMHYPTFKYVIFKNLKLYHKRKKKKIFKLKSLTNNNIAKNFYENMFFLRTPDTYTKRGILNNQYPLIVRKQKAATHR